MKHLISIFLIIFISGCSLQVVDMTDGATPQKFDLTDPDADGVIIARDNCVESFDGAKVNNNGCGTDHLHKVRRKLEVHFTNNSSFVAPEYVPEIHALANFMKEYDSAKVTIEGHTSKVGSAKLNKTLSQKRAQAVKDILVNKFAIDESRITAIGYGFEKLLLEGDDEYIHARNRRIVAEISSEESLTDMKWTIYSVDQPAN